MRFLLAIFFLVQSLRAAISVDHYQDFHTGTNGTLLSTGVLARSSLGAGQWQFYTTSGSDTSFTSWTVTNRTAFTYPIPLSVGGTNIYTTGTNAIFWDMNTANDVEEARWFPPGSVYDYSNMLMSCFFNMGAVADSTDRNYDHFQFTGGYFCVCQQQVGGISGDRLISHSANVAGSTNGGPFTIDPGAWYYIQFLRDYTRGRCSWKIYNPTNFALLETSLVGMGSPDFGAQVFRLMAHYLNQQPGTTTVMGISLSYADPQLDFFEPAISAHTIARGNVRMSGKVVLR